MSETLTTLSPADFQQAWARGTEELLNRTTGSGFSCEVRAREGSVPPVGQYARFSVAGPLEGEAALFVTPEAAVSLTQLFPGTPQDKTAELDSPQLDGLADIFRQLAANVNAAFASSTSEKDAVTFCDTEAPSWLLRCRAGFDVHAHGPNLPELALHLLLSPELAAAFASEPVSPPTFSSHEPMHTRHETNLQFLKDVEVGVSLRFGKTNLRLHKVLEMMPGEVMELDQQVQDPVELLVGNRVIAKGEVVVVDGNYGLRITDVVSPSERIESLCD